MKVTIAAIGRAKRGVLRDLYTHYADRMSWQISLKELEVKGKRPAAEQTRMEAELLLSAVPDRAKIIALDERGKTLSSPELAQKIGGWADQGDGEIALIIGGADGLDDTVRRHADLTLALGKLTWPHMLARAMVMEQLYRAQQIIAGHPYHRE